MKAVIWVCFLIQSLEATFRREKINLVSELGIGADQICKIHASDMFLLLNCGDKAYVYSHKIPYSFKQEYVEQQQVYQVEVTLDQGISYGAGQELHHFYLDNQVVKHEKSSYKGAVNYFVTNSISFYQDETQTFLDIYFKNNLFLMGQVKLTDEKAIAIGLDQTSDIIKLLICNQIGFTYCRLYTITKPFLISDESFDFRLTSSMSLKLVQLKGNYIITQDNQRFNIFKFNDDQSITLIHFGFDYVYDILPKLNIRSLTNGVQLFFDADFEFQSRNWYVVNTMTFVHTSFQAVQNRFIFDRHMTQLIYEYEQHSELHPFYNEQFDLMTSSVTPSMFIFVGVTDTGLNLYYSKLCDLNQDPSWNCQQVDSTHFVDQTAWVQNTEPVVKPCQAIYSGFTKVLQFSFCEGRNVDLVSKVSEYVSLDILESKECQVSQYKHRVGLCANCFQNCEFCVDNTVCQQCVGKLQLLDNDSKCGCPDNYFIKNQECEACPIGCTKCLFTSCSECKVGFQLLNNQCVKESCKSYEYAYQDQCIRCPNNCATCDNCVNVANCNVCTSCYNGFGLTSLKYCDYCDIGYYSGSNSICTKCREGCAECTGALSCQKCQPNYFLLGGVCRLCDYGNYLDLNGVCWRCRSNCAECTNSFDCLRCDPGYTYSQNICKQCPAGTFSIGLDCKNCAENCQSCTSMIECTKCKSGNKLNSGICFPIECQNGQYLLGDNCRNCMLGCNKCSSFLSCDECADNYSLVLGKCQKCLSGYYFSLGQCLPCQSNCLSCSRGDDCDLCSKGFVKVGTKCIYAIQPTSARREIIDYLDDVDISNESLCNLVATTLLVAVYCEETLKVYQFETGTTQIELVYNTTMEVTFVQPTVNEGLTITTNSKVYHIFLPTEYEFTERRRLSTELFTTEQKILGPTNYYVTNQLSILMNQQKTYMKILVQNNIDSEIGKVVMPAGLPFTPSFTFHNDTLKLMTCTTYKPTQCRFFEILNNKINQKKDIAFSESEQLSFAQYINNYFILQTGQMYEVYQLDSNYTAIRIFQSVDILFDNLPKIKAQRLKYGMSIYLDADGEAQDRFWYVATQITFVLQSAQQVKNRIVYDRHMYQYMYGYTNDHKILHNNQYYEQSDLKSYAPTSTGLFILGKSDKGLSLHFMRQCQFDEDPNNYCQLLEDSFIDIKSWLQKRSSFIRRCSDSSVGFAKQIQYAVCDKNSTLIEPVTESFELDIVDEKPCSPGQYQQLNGQCANCQSGCAFCEQADKCQQCQGSLVLMNNFQCGCLPGFFNKMYECVQCPSNCDTCLFTSCTKCSTGYKLTQTSSCEEISCGKSQVLVGNDCVFCSAGCTECQSCKNIPNCSQCDKCQTGYELQKDTLTCRKCLKNEYYSNGWCLPCQDDCNECTSSDNCLDCKDDLVPIEDKCEKCPTGTYLSKLLTKQCINCSQNCQVCSSLFECSRCNEGYLLQNNTNCIECPQKTYFSADGCKQCASGCLKCTGENQCLLCDKGYVLEQGLCKQKQCPQSQYLDGDQCFPCFNGCLDCSSSTDCTFCSSDHELVNQRCEKCKNNQYYLFQKCYDCDQRCTSCTSKTNCLTCLPDYALKEGICVECENNTIANEGKCEKCPISTFYEANKCKKCAQGCMLCDSLNNCLQCERDYKLVWGICIEIVCDPKQYIQNSKCYDCEQNCLECDSTQCFQCELGYQLVQSKCQKCLTGQFYREGVCSDCGSKCQQCESQLSCTKCFDGYGLNEGKCQQCFQGQFLSEKTQKCEECPIFCEECIDLDQCTKCKSGYLLTREQQCQQCPDQTYFSNQLNQCLRCEENCFSCTNLGNCNVCFQGFNLIDGKCVRKECLSNEYLQGDNCKKCADGCETCTDIEKCTTCSKNYQLFDSVCVPCNRTQYYSSTFKSCLDCAPRCETCSEEGCIQCKPTFARINNKCQYCKQSEYLDEQECYPCPDSCLKCNSSTSCTECQKGYFLNNSICQKCQENCLSCESDSWCNSCESRYELVFSDPIKTCVERECSLGEYLSNGLCLKCPTKCLSCSLSATNELKCLECQTGYFLQDEKYCLKCQNGCKTCIEVMENLKCLECDNKLVISPSSDQCVPCSRGQYIDEKLDPDICLECSEELMNCEHCENSEKCIECGMNYTMTEDFKCRVNCNFMPDHPTCYGISSIVSQKSSGVQDLDYLQVGAILGIFLIFIGFVGLIVCLCFCYQQQQNNQNLKLIKLSQKQLQTQEKVREIQYVETELKEVNNRKQKLSSESIKQPSSQTTDKVSTKSKLSTSLNSRNKNSGMQLSKLSQTQSVNRDRYQQPAHQSEQNPSIYLQTQSSDIPLRENSSNSSPREIRIQLKREQEFLSDSFVIPEQSIEQSQSLQFYPPLQSLQNHFEDEQLESSQSNDLSQSLNDAIRLEMIRKKQNERLQTRENLNAQKNMTQLQKMEQFIDSIDL